MFKAINDKINLSFESDTTKPKVEIIEWLKQGAARQSRLSFLHPDHVDFSEFKFLDDTIEVSRVPGMFTAFRAYGKIRMTLREIRPNVTRIRFDVMPGNNSIPLTVTFQTFAVLIWSAGWIILGRELDYAARFLMPAGLLALVTLISYFRYRSARQAFVDYSKTLMKMIRNSEPSAESAGSHR